MHEFPTAPKQRHLRLASIAAMFVAAACNAESLHVAVAANFATPMQSLAARFEAQTKVAVVVSFASTGQLYAQIVHGAPYDVFFSADVDRPRALLASKLADPATHRTYAQGRLALVADTPLAATGDAQGFVLPTFRMLAIANPDVAPYGIAARDAIETAGHWDAVRERVVYGENVMQAYQFFETGAAEAAIVAWSLVHDRTPGTVLVLPEALHPPVCQNAVVLTSASDPALARRFLAWELAPEAQSAIADFGYALPDAQACDGSREPQ